jgi:hypothetical protein
MPKTLRDYSSVREPDAPPPPKPPRTAPGMRQAIIYNTEEALQQLKVLAAERGTTISALVGEGMNHVFRTYGKAMIAIDRHRPAKAKE